MTNPGAFERCLIEMASLLPLITTRIRPLDAGLWEIMAKPMSEWAPDEAAYVAMREREGEEQ